MPRGFPVPAEQFYEQLCSTASRGRWDQDCLRCMEVEKLSPSCSIVYSVMRTPSAVLSDRDYLCLRFAGPDEIDDARRTEELRCNKCLVSRFSTPTHDAP